MARDCIKCGESSKVAIGGADPDLAGIPACNECKEEVKQDLLLVLTDSIPEYDYEWFEEKYELNEK